MYLCLFPAILTLIFAEKDSSIVNDEILNKIRIGFYVAVEDEDTTAYYMKFIKDNFSSDYKKYSPVVLAYYAALEGLKGRHASNPISKFVYVSRAVDKMNHAVDNDPELLEGRFLRFSFFHQIPGIFGMAGKVPEDLQKVITMLEKRDYSFVNENIQKDMVEYILGTDQLDAAQRTRLEQLNTELKDEP